MTAATIFEVCTSIFPLLSLTLTLVALPRPASTTSRNNALVVILPSPGPCPPQPPPTSLRHSLVGLPHPGPPCSNHQRVVMTRWWFFSPAPVLTRPNRHQRVYDTRWWVLAHPGPPIHQRVAYHVGVKNTAQFFTITQCKVNKARYIADNKWKGQNTSNLQV